MEGRNEAREEKEREAYWITWVRPSVVVPNPMLSLLALQFWRANGEYSVAVLLSFIFNSTPFAFKFVHLFSL